MGCARCSICCDRSTRRPRSEEHTSELQSQSNLVCRLLLEKKKYFVSTHFLIHMPTAPTCLAGIFFSPYNQLWYLDRTYPWPGQSRPVLALGQHAFSSMHI